MNIIPRTIKQENHQSNGLLIEYDIFKKKEEF